MEVWNIWRQLGKLGLGSQRDLRLILLKKENTVFLKESYVAIAYISGSQTFSCQAPLKLCVFFNSQKYEIMVNTFTATYAFWHFQIYA